jgi:drug/metabolite transporter (DMT)-like permease
VTRYGPPAAFVLLWSSGFIAGTIGTRHAPALALTTWRFALAALVLAALARAAGAPFPRDRRTLGHLAVAGLLLQALQFGGGYLGLAAGTPAAMSSLIMSACPLVVAVAAIPLFGERPAPRAWAGLALGFGGVLVAVADHLHGTGPAGMALTALGLAGFAGGTLYQRRFAATVDLRAGGAISLAVAALAVAPIALLRGDGLAIPASTGALGALAWLALVNSVGAMSLLLWLMRRGGAAATTSVLYLVPPTTALLAALVLHQRLDAPVLAALAIAAAGVALAARRPAAARPAPAPQRSAAVSR